jgi:hypothetical protein
LKRCGIYPQHASLFLVTRCDPKQAGGGAHVFQLIAQVTSAGDPSAARVDAQEPAISVNGIELPAARDHARKRVRSGERMVSSRQLYRSAHDLICCRVDA